MNSRAFSRYSLLTNLCLVVVLIPCLVGCQKTSQPEAKIKLKYWEKWTGFELEAMQKVVDRFNQSQDRIEVEMMSISQLDRKLLVAVAGGNPPDIAGLTYEYLPSLAQMNAIYPLDGFLEKHLIDREDYIPVFWDQCTYEGFLWALPTTGACVAYHYNKKMFREAGLDPEKPPVTVEELVAIENTLNRIQGNRVERLVFVPVEPNWWPYCWPWFFGGDLWDGKGKLTLTSQASLAAYRWVADYPRRIGPEKIHPFRSGFGNLFASPQNPFLSGKLVSILQGSWMHNFVRKYAPAMEFGAAPMPVSQPELYGTTLVEADVIFIPKDCKNPAASFEFIAFAASQLGTEMLCNGLMSVNPRRVRSEEFIKNHPNPNISLFDQMVMSDKVHYAPKVSMWYEMLDEMTAAVDKIWLQEQSPEVALQEAQNRLQTRLDEELDRWNQVSEVRRKEWSQFVHDTAQEVDLQ